MPTIRKIAPEIATTWEEPTVGEPALYQRCRPRTARKTGEQSAAELLSTAAE